MKHQQVYKLAQNRGYGTIYSFSGLTDEQETILNLTLIQEWMRKIYHIDVEYFERYLYLVVQYEEDDSRMEHWKLKPSQPLASKLDAMVGGITAALTLI